MKLEELRAGLELGPSSWIEISQARIDAFAEVTEDRQPIHIDLEAAAAGPYGTTVAHGFLTLALIPAAARELLKVEGVTGLNYGLNRVRFPAPVPAGSRVRAIVRIDAVEPVDGGVQVTANVAFECDAVPKPVCVAEHVFRYLR